MMKTMKSTKLAVSNNVKHLILDYFGELQKINLESGIFFARRTQNTIQTREKSFFVPNWKKRKLTIQDLKMVK